jgi:hypothetical protein
MEGSLSEGNAIGADKTASRQAVAVHARGEQVPGAGSLEHNLEHSQEKFS